MFPIGFLCANRFLSVVSTVCDQFWCPVRPNWPYISAFPSALADTLSAAPLTLSATNIGLHFLLFVYFFCAALYQQFQSHSVCLHLLPFIMATNSNATTYEVNEDGLLVTLDAEFTAFYKTLISPRSDGKIHSPTRPQVEEFRLFYDRAFKLAKEATKAAVAMKYRLDLSEDQLSLHTATLNDHTDALKRIEELLSNQVLPAISAPSAHTCTASGQTSSQPAQDKPVTWSMVAKSRPKTQPKPDHPVFIRPKRSGITSEQTHKALRQTVDPLTFGKSTTRVMPAENGQLVVGLDKPAAQEALRQALVGNQTFDSRFEVYVPKKRLPRILIREVPTSLDDKALIHTLHTMNPELSTIEPDFMTFEQKVKIVLHLKTKNKDIINVIIECQPHIARVLDKMPRVRLHWTTHQVGYHILVTRCFNCNQLGHRANGKHPDGNPDPCKLPRACSQCSGPHKYVDCTVDKATVACCPSCTAENAKNGTTIDTFHNAHSDSCPTLQRYKQAEFKRTDYGF